jgi:hypothetical protein
MSLTAATNGPIVHPRLIYENGEPRLNDSDRVKPKKEKILSQCHFVLHKSQTGRPRREAGPPLLDVGD